MLRYFRLSRSAWYSYLFVLPLLALYHASVLVFSLGQPLTVVNGADALIQSLLRAVGAPAGGLGVVLVTALAGWIIIRRDAAVRQGPLRRSFFAWMLLESAVYAASLGTVVSLLSVPFLPQAWLQLPGGATPLSFGQRLAISLGAGLYEELVFRLVLMGGLILILRRLRWKPGAALLGAAIAAALLFSGFHYLGPLGEPFRWESFVFRWVAGMVLAALYGLRGFGIAVYTHALYDLFLLFSLPDLG